MQGHQDDKKADILNIVWNIPHEIWFMASQLLQNVSDPVRDGQASKYSDAWLSVKMRFISIWKNNHKIEEERKEE